MGYFANGSEGDWYTERYCMKCVNWRDNGTGSEGCPVIDLHMLWNYDAIGKKADKVKAEALSHFIPIEGIGNAQCVMFQMTPEASQRELERAGQQRFPICQ